MTLIELVVVMTILALLVTLAVPKLMGHTKEANRTRLISDAKILEDACHRYYMDHGDWPRLTDDAYSAEQVESFAERVLDATGQVVELEPEGNYYDLDMLALAPYVRIHADSSYFVLQNPVGKVFTLTQCERADISL